MKAKAAVNQSLNSDPTASQFCGTLTLRDIFPDLALGCTSVPVGAELVGQFLTADTDHVMTGVLLGEGDLTVGRSSDSIWVHDADTGYYAEIAGTYAGFEGGAVASNLVYNIVEGGFEFADPPWLLVRPAATNSLQHNRDITVTSGSWTPSTGAASAADATGIDGGANSAHTITDSSGTVSAYYEQTVAIPDDSNTHSLVLWHAKTSAATTHPRHAIRLTGGTGEVIQLNFMVNTNTGAGVIPSGSGEITVADDGDFWKVTMSLANNGTGNTSLGVRIGAANWDGTTASNDVALTGSCVVDCPMVLLNTAHDVAKVQPPIFTTTTAVTREADDYTLSSDNLNDYQGSLYAEVWFDGDDNLLNGFLYRSGGNLTLDDGTTTASIAVDTGEWVDVGIAWSVPDGKMDLYLNGAWVGEVAYDETLLSGDFDLFRSATYGGYIRNLRIYSDGSVGIAPVITTLTLDAMTEDEAFSQTLVATGNGTITWSVSAGALPDGIILSSAGVLSGTPTTAGAYDFTVQAENGTGSDTQQYTGDVLGVGGPVGDGILLEDGFYLLAENDDYLILE